MKKFLLFIGINLSNSLFAHGFDGSGWLHPITGIDHMVAMIAVGAWSAQLGNKAIFIVPGAFACCMLIGGIFGFEKIPIQGTETGIMLSVIFLGASIALEKKITIIIAALGVGIFGFCYGYAHGLEIPESTSKFEYAFGFISATIGLHIIGAVGGLIILKHPDPD